MWYILCDKCKLQYVGETCQNLNKRFNWHSSCFRNPAKYAFCKSLNSHFDIGYCKGSSYTVNILEMLEGTGRTDRNAGAVAERLRHRSREQKVPSSSPAWTSVLR